MKIRYTAEIDIPFMRGEWLRMSEADRIDYLKNETPDHIEIEE